MTRIVYLILAYVFLALAIIGVFLPLLPTVPFLLLTAWCAARGSEKLHRWLYNHPLLGKLLTDWETQKAIPRKSKIVAVLMLMMSWMVIYFRLNNMWLLVSITILFLVVSAYLISRPEPD